MTEDIDKLLDKFHEESSDRLEILMQLGNSNDERVISQYIATLEDFSEDDLVRIEILKSLELRSDAAPVHSRFGKVVQHVLENDDDDLVRQYAAMALGNYISVRGTLAMLESIVANESEDIDVRHNALSSIEMNKSHAFCRAALQRLTQVPELGRSAQRTLDSM